MKRLCGLLGDDTGASMVEYALIISLLAGAIIVAGQAMSSSLQGMYAYIHAALSGA